MLTIEGQSGRPARLPLIARMGVAVLLFGVLEDLVAHSLGGSPASAGGHTDAQMLGHLVVFVGMVLILLGVVVDGVRQAKARRESARQTSKGVA